MKRKEHFLQYQSVEPKTLYDKLVLLIALFTIFILPLILTAYMAYYVYSINKTTSSLRYISIGLIFLAVLFINYRKTTCNYFDFNQISSFETLFICISFTFIGLTIHQKHFNLYSIASCLASMFISRSFLKYGEDLCN